MDDKLAVPSHLTAPASEDSPSIDSITDYVLLQSAALLKVSGRVETYKEGVDMAREALSSGGARKAWEGFVKVSRELTPGNANVEEDGGEAAKGGMVPAWLHPKKDSKKDNKEKSQGEK